MPLARTFPANQWCATAFHGYVARIMQEAGAEHTEAHKKTVYDAILMHAIPAGNA